jgi:RNAse (barnase) inhibitor barstar
MTGRIHNISIDGAKIVDWESFHDQFSQVFGFPGFYGRNMNAWIDCMTHLDTDFSSFEVGKGDLVMVEISSSDRFHEASELSSALYECAAFVNGRRVKRGDPPILIISSAL